MPKAGDVADRRVLSVDGLASLPHRLGSCEAAAERRHEVEQVVADVRGLPFRRDDDVHRVERIDPRVVQPGREHVQPPQVAPVLVRHDVVRIVVARAEELKRADQRLALRRHAERDGPVAPVGSPRDGRHEAVDVLGHQGAKRSKRRDVARVALHDQPLAIEDDQVASPARSSPARGRSAMRSISAPVASSGASGGSNRSRYIWLPASRKTMVGREPGLRISRTRHGPAEGSRAHRQLPAAAASRLSLVRPWRLTYHAPSSTSPSVLTPWAPIWPSRGCRSPGLPRVADTPRGGS